MKAHDLEARTERQSVAVVIPCYNEEVAIASVVSAFRRCLPSARIVVVDNASSDATGARAREAGAEVLRETRRGKGFALATGFRATSEADFIIMVDGDDTYPAEAAPLMLARARDGADMVIGTRLEQYQKGAYRPGHAFGNRFFVALVRAVFGARTKDLLSGYRVLTRRFLESSPLIARGFEVESELSLQALVGAFRVDEIPVEYRARPPDSFSKLRTYSDGYRILLALLTFFRDYRPLTFFGLLGLTLIGLGALAGGIVVFEYLKTHLVLRLPLAVLAVGLWILGGVSLIAGVMLSSINRRALELATMMQRK